MCPIVRARLESKECSHTRLADFDEMRPGRASDRSHEMPIDARLFPYAGYVSRLSTAEERFPPPRMDDVLPKERIQDIGNHQSLRLEVGRHNRKEGTEILKMI